MSPSSNAEQRPRYLLLLPVPRALEVEIEDRFLSIWGASRPPMGYHVTLVGPFYWEVTHHDAPLLRVQEVCAGTMPLQLRVQDLDVFENSPDDCAVFVEIGPVRRLQRFHRRLIRALGAAATMQYHREEPFRPHITLGLNLPRESCAGLRTKADDPLRAHFPAQELRLLKQLGQGPWQPLLAFALGNRDAPHTLANEQHDG